MRKLLTLKKVIVFSREIKDGGGTIGLVVGSFDILHLGHLNLFRFAKRYVDKLIVGLDHDLTIRNTKGKGRPINNYPKRVRFLEDISTVDKTFLISKISTHGTQTALENYRTLLELIKPTHVFSHHICDKHWRKKKEIAQSLGITCLIDKSKKVCHSGDIIRRILES